MTLSTALKTGDLSALPSRRDEDWRWTDLRGLLRVLPPAAPAHDGAVPAGPFASLADAETVFVNGRRVTASDAGGSGSTVTGRKASGGVAGRGSAKSRRHLKSSEVGMPCRWAVAEACRWPTRLSSTIRRFSSSDQRRRRPVSTTVRRPTK